MNLGNDDDARPTRIDPASLVEQCLSGNEQAWERLIRQYANLIHATIRRVGLDVDDAEEAFQATTVAIFQQLPALRSPETLVSWIIGIAYRQGINVIRRKTRRPRGVELEEASAQTLEANPGDLPDEDLQRLESHQRIDECLHQLPDRCHALLRELFYGDLPPDYAAISKRLSMPVGSIGPTRARCLAKLRQILERSGWEP